jgi:general stress protein 26
MTELIRYGKLTKNQLEAFLCRPLLARLATAVPVKGNPGLFQPHNVPVWFEWDGEALYISAFQSTRKAKEVKRNPYIAVLIDVMESIDGVSAVLMEGKSVWIDDPELVQKWSRSVYAKYYPGGVLDAAAESWVVDPENSIIKLIPTKIYTW